MTVGTTKINSLEHWSLSDMKGKNIEQIEKSVILDAVLDDNASNERTSQKTTRIHNIRGGRLVLTFNEEGLLVSAEIVRGGEYGKTNKELGRISKEEPDDKNQSKLSTMQVTSRYTANLSPS